MRRSRAVATLVAVVAVGGSACTPDEPEAQLDFRATVSVEGATKGTVERVLTTTGTVRARQEAKIGVETPGELQLARNPVTRERLRVGDAVAAGQLLAVVAGDEIRTSSRLEARRTALARAEADYERNRALHEQGLVSQQVIDEQSNALASARAELDNALLQVGKARLTAPFSGIISKVTTAADGERLGAGVIVAEVVEFDEVFVDLDLGSGDVLDLAPGLPVRLRSYDAARVFDGVVERIAPAIDPASRTFRVEVRARNPEHALRPGMFVKAEVVLESRADTLVVPTSSIVERDGKTSVFVAEAQRVELRSVDLGLVSEATTEIRSGLALGERVVVSGQETLQDGSRVNVRD